MEVVVFRARRMIHVYELHLFGRRWYRALSFTTDARFCYASLQPDTGARREPWAAAERHAAGERHPQPVTEKSTVIERHWQAEANLSFGTEQYVPSRLLTGLLPAAILEAYQFWQGEDDNLRGYPTAKSDGCMYSVRLLPGYHVADFGSAAASMQLSGKDKPMRAVVVRLSLSRCQAHRTAVLSALNAVEAFLCSHDGLLVGAFEPNFHALLAVDALVRALSADSETSVEPFKPEAIKARVTELLAQIQDCTPLQRKRDAHRTASLLVTDVAAILTQLYAHDDEWQEAMEAEAVEAPRSPTCAPACTAEVEGGNLVLLDLLNAPPDSQLYSLATTASRLENLSHVLAFARYDANADLSRWDALTHDDLWLVMFPRLQLVFEARRRANGAVRLFSVDHNDVFVTNERPAPLLELLDGIPHSLLLSDSNGDLSVLVPAVLPFRPSIGSEPFSTELGAARMPRPFSSIAPPNRVSISRVFAHVHVPSTYEKGCREASCAVPHLPSAYVERVSQTGDALGRHDAAGTALPAPRLRRRLHPRRLGCV
jgi:hypothetical protein